MKKQTSEEEGLIVRVAVGIFGSRAVAWVKSQIVRSWKTTAAGSSTVLTSGYQLVELYQAGGLTASSALPLVASALAGMGLIAAKDHNVTGNGKKR